MNQVRSPAVALHQDAFSGTATHYARHRIPYPAALVDDLLARVSATGDGRLLDLACGPGRIAIPFSSSFREVWAVDREPEMIEVGRREARRRGADNIRWIVAKAEDLDADPLSFQLITIGDAFHWLDQRLVGERALQWLVPGGCIAVMGCYNLMRGTEPWQGIVVETVGKWVDLRASAKAPSIQPNPGSGRDEPVLREAGFTDVESFRFVQRHLWTLDAIIGHLYSTSRVSQRILGNLVGEFENDLRRVLLDYDSSGRYAENRCCGYTIARKPGGV